MNHRLNRPIMVLTACLLTSGLMAVEKTEVDFVVAGAATTEANRHYFELVEEFNNLNSDILVKPVVTSEWDQVSSLAKESIDKKRGTVFVVEISQVESTRLKKIASSVDDLIKGEPKEFMNDIVPTFLGNSKGQDKNTYCLPFMRSFPAAYYNLNLLKSVGITKENLPQTYADLEATLKKAKSLNITPFGLGSGWTDWLFESSVLSSGKGLSDKNGKIDFDTKEAIAMLDKWKDWKKQGLLELTPNWKATMNTFLAGQYAVIFYSIAGIGTLKEKANFEWATLPLPLNKIKTINQGAGNICIGTEQTDLQKKASWKFIKFMLSKSSQLKTALATGYFPVTKSALESEEYAKNYARPEILDEFKQVIKNAKPKLMTANFDKVRTAIKDALTKAIDEGAESKAVLKKAEEESLKAISEF